MSLKVVVIGGSGLIGSKVVANLTEQGHEAIAASPQSGVNTLTGEGLAEVLAGAQVVLDVSNSPSFADDDVLHFFTTSTGNLLAAERAAGVEHHVALSVVGSDRNPNSGYLRAKDAQEKLIKESGAAYSIVRATQFYEFVAQIAGSATEGNVVRLPHALMQPMAADDVATAVTRAVTGAPVNGVTEVAGPEKIAMDDFVRTGLAAQGDPRQVVADSQAPYFGEVIDDHSIVPADGATLAGTRFADWLASHVTSGAR
ncbi:MULTISPECIES: SDR family oxidoreductase [unclassified Mycobacterium]|uniref:SDR family oxidoreductase n=1 Tax=unclassified Mycobacterium TaxID=2642494 RepID=UPI0029C87ED0|nr:MULTISPECIES: SDR family oxidoreductase [unclassified Mycobacterium]